jgi:hypothetical protein
VHAGHLHPDHSSVPASAETYRYPCNAIMGYICTLSDIASAHILSYEVTSR